MTGFRKTGGHAARVATGTIARLATASTIIVVMSLAGGTASAASSAPSLPRRIGASSPWTSDPRSAPIGAASVAFSGNEWWYDGSQGYVGLVGANQDAYRMIQTDSGAAGMEAVLSPDGHLLAERDTIVDLHTGSSSSLPAALQDKRADARFTVPQAWSPDGHHLAVVSYAQPFNDSSEGVMPLTDESLRVVDTTTNVITTIANLDTSRWMPGWTAAFSPDGTELAYQSGSTIHVARIDGTAVSAFTVASGVSLAGKGAWTPDGHALMLVSAARCSCDEQYDVRWTLSTVNPRDGASVGSTYTVSGLYAIRLLGWWPSGTPVVAAYQAESETPVNLFGNLNDQGALRQLDDVKTVTVAALTAPGAMRVLLSAARYGAESIDVADDVLASGVTRAGNPPLLTFDNIAYAGFALAVLLVLTITTTLFVLWRRRRSRMAVASPG